MYDSISVTKCLAYFLEIQFLPYGVPFEIQDRSKGLVLNPLSLMSCFIWVVEKATSSWRDLVHCKVVFKAVASAGEVYVILSFKSEELHLIKWQLGSSLIWSGNVDFCFSRTLHALRQPQSEIATTCDRYRQRTWFCGITLIVTCRVLVSCITCTFTRF